MKLKAINKAVMIRPFADTQLMASCQSPLIPSVENNLLLSIIRQRFLISKGRTFALKFSIIYP